MSENRSNIRPSRPPTRNRINRSVLVRRAALALLTIAALGGAATAGPAQARPLEQCDGPCSPPPKPPTNDPRSCADCNSGATNHKQKQQEQQNQKQKTVRVYRSTRAYSTPYLDALRSVPLSATTYVATCEANSGSRGRHSNPWWSRLRNGYWVNNGDLKGPAKTGIGDCPPPPNDKQQRRRGCDDCNVPSPRPKIKEPSKWDRDTKDGSTQLGNHKFKEKPTDYVGVLVKGNFANWGGHGLWIEYASATFLAPIERPCNTKLYITFFDVDNRKYEQRVSPLRSGCTWARTFAYTYETYMRPGRVCGAVSINGVMKPGACVSIYR